MANVPTIERALGCNYYFELTTPRSCGINSSGYYHLDLINGPPKMFNQGRVTYQLPTW